ncbi:uncharacterized protein [Rutidosis leptorrhynchoides]|uniref:uncharacterized protein n=1 Tax=Rutidosis leptorrhynchoides TaxID=125765 RepID=UPI003A9967A2
MSWLARSIANTLVIEDNPNLNSSNSPPNHFKFQQQQIQSSEVEDRDRSGSVKEDLSELTETLTRQFHGVASFLAPPPPNSQPDPSVSDRDCGDSYISGEDDHDHVPNLDGPDSLGNNEIECVGVTEEALAFAKNISNHPETWLDFPLSEEEDDDDFEMSDTQWNHVTLVERLAPGLAALRIELCPIHMSESYFWKVYFVLLHPRLNKHDADLLSTPQIVAARSMWVKELQKRTNESEFSDGSNFLHEDSATASDSPSTNTSAHAFEPTVTHKYSFAKSDNLMSVNVEQKTSLDCRAAYSYTMSIEDDDDDDDWFHRNSEPNGYVGADVHFGTDEDISFSDLEADDDCTMPIRSKKGKVSLMCFLSIILLYKVVLY